MLMKLANNGTASEAGYIHTLAASNSVGPGALEVCRLHGENANWIAANGVHESMSSRKNKNSLTEFYLRLSLLART